MLKLNALNIVNELKRRLENLPVPGRPATEEINHLESRVVGRLFSLLETTCEERNFVEEIGEEETLALEEEDGDVSAAVAVYEDEEDDDYDPLDERAEKKKYTCYERAKRVVEYRERYKQDHGNYPHLKTLTSRFGISDYKELKRLLEIFEKGGTAREKYERIGEFTFNQFVAARQDGSTTNIYECGPSKKLRR